MSLEMTIGCVVAFFLGASLCGLLMCSLWERQMGSARRDPHDPVGPRIAVWKHEPMTEGQLIAALRGWTLEDERCRAVLQVIEEEKQNAGSEAGALGLSDSERAHTCGGWEWLNILQANLGALIDGEPRGTFKPSARARTEEAE